MPAVSWMPLWPRSHAAAIVDAARCAGGPPPGMQPGRPASGESGDAVEEPAEALDVALGTANFVEPRLVEGPARLGRVPAQRFPEGHAGLPGLHRRLLHQ